jgi:hypothetical protein
MRIRKCALAGAVAGILLVSAHGASAIVLGVVDLTDPNNPVIDDAISLNDFIGATSFYNAGYYGQSSIVANIEGGFVWPGHDAFVNGQVTQFLLDPANTSLALPAYSDHATGVGSILSGLGPFFIFSDGTSGFSSLNFGMAPLSQLWTGAVATTLNNDGSFDITTNSAFIVPYRTAMITGINGSGPTADVINSSWGETPNFPDTTAGSNGDDYFAIAIDAMVAQSGKTMVFAAGNSGPTSQVNSPASGFNSIVVGALGSVTDANPYNTPSNFTNGAPNDFFLPAVPDGSVGVTIPGVRAVVSLAAPGENFIVAAYTGDVSQTSFYSINAAGTSFASPTVAGGATLVVDAGKNLFPSDSKAIDGRVVKAVLMNSADKTQGWDNGQHLVAGVITTTQSLDYSTGAGRMDLNRAYDQYTAGTTDVPGLGGGIIAPIGWDYGQVGLGAPNDYPIDSSLTAGSLFTATLDWFAIDNLDASNTDYNVTYGKFDNLDLQVWTDIDGRPGSLIAQSDSLYNSTEHLYFPLPSDGMYLIQVLWDGSIYNLLPVGDPNNTTSDDFGLAWSVTQVPEPTTGALVCLATATLLSRRRRTNRDLAG